MGIIITIKVITKTNQAGWPRTIQLGNREQVIIIKCINALGIIIPLLIIFKVVIYQAAQYKNNIILHNWLISISDNSQIINEIGLIWLTEVFYKHIKDRTVSTYRLLVLDGHNSHVLPEFNQFCLDHQIVVLYIPAHLLYLLQPLDIGCFLVLKQAYGHLIKQIISRGVNHINKREFLPIYRQARQVVIHQSNIQAGFAATSLVPYNPDRVLLLLYTECQILLP